LEDLRCDAVDYGGSGKEQEVGFCEVGYELSCSIEDVESVDQLNDYQLLKKASAAWELVNVMDILTL
jgi:hypothetical protein